MKPLPLRGRRDEGQILALALFFLVALAAIGVSLGAYATTSLTASNSFQRQLSLQYTAQSALGIALDQFRVHQDDGLPYSGTASSGETCPLSGSSYDLAQSPPSPANTSLTKGTPPTYGANGDTVSVSCVGLDPAGGTPDVMSVSGGAFGLETTGLIPVAGTPTVTLPAGGHEPPLTASGAGSPSLLSALLTLGVLNVSTQGANIPGSSGTATSSASVTNAKVLGVLSANLLSIGAISTTCTSSATGSSASTSVTTLTVAGAPVTLPNPLPANYSLVGGLGSLTSVEFNVQTSTNAVGSTGITVIGAEIVALGTTIELAGSSCGASGPEVDAGPDLTSGRRVLFTISCVSAAFGSCPSGPLITADVEFGDVLGQTSTQVIKLSYWSSNY